MSSFCYVIIPRKFERPCRFFLYRLHYLHCNLIRFCLANKHCWAIYHFLPIEGHIFTENSWLFITIGYFLPLIPFVPQKATSEKITREFARFTRWHSQFFFKLSSSIVNWRLLSVKGFTRPSTFSFFISLGRDHRSSCEQYGRRTKTLALKFSEVTASRNTNLRCLLRKVQYNAIEFRMPGLGWRNVSKHPDGERFRW